MLSSCCGAAHQPSNPAEPNYTSHGEAEQPVDAVSPPVLSTLEEQACAEADESGRDDPDYNDKRDLCAQYRAAVAAEDNARLACIQTWIGAGGLVAVIFTLVFTGVSAREAANSAAAAAASNSQAQEFFSEERRPWLSADLRFVRPPIVDFATHDVAIDVLTRNVGLTPAVHVSIVVQDGNDLPENWSAASMRRLQEEVKSAKSVRQPGVALFPQQEPERDSVFIAFPFKNRAGSELTRFIGGFVRYEQTDKPGVIHTTPFCFLVVIYFNDDGVYEDIDMRPFLINIGPD